MKYYETISGDMWDIIAKKVYGDECYTSFLLENNKELAKYFIFPNGIKIKIADLPETKSTYYMPTWRN